MFYIGREKGEENMLIMMQMLSQVPRGRIFEKPIVDQYHTIHSFSEAPKTPENNLDSNQLSLSKQGHCQIPYHF